MKKVITSAALLIFTLAACAQTAFVRDLTIPLYQNGNLMNLAWAGGINGGMFSEVDLNGDGIKDLFVFEKDQAYKKARITTYINNGTPNKVDYVYAPQYISHFPPLSDWAIMVDYNCDGKEDLLTYSNQLSAAGITVYKNVSVGSNLQFQLEYPLLTASSPSGSTNLYVSAVDKPGVTDEDGDGDIDIFGLAVGGGSIVRYKNIAEETLGRCDTLIFEWQSGCWGHFGINYYNQALLGLSCRYAPSLETSETNPPISNDIRDGSSCMEIFDFDGNGSMDYLSGDPSMENMLLAQNGGVPGVADMLSQDSTFPVYDVPVMMYLFADPSLVDVNNDGKKDLLVSPCTNGGAENYHSVWYYKNTGTPSTPYFSYQANNFLIDQMADLGEGANVCFVDADADGLTDILVGNRGYFNGTKIISGTPFPAYLSGLAFYKNTGTASQPEFALQTIDWMNVFADSLTGVHPAFGDLDGDGDLDMILGEETGKLYYYENTGGQGNPMLFVTPPVAYYFSIDVGKFAAPQLFDMDKDNLLDLVIGNQLGKLWYYKNTGTSTNPVFTFQSNNFGGVSVTQGLGATGYADPFFYRDSLGNTKALVSNEHGNIFYYDNIDGNLGGNFALIDTSYKGINEPIRATISGADINADGLMDLVVGNQAGGFTIYKQVSTAGVAGHSPDLSNLFSLYPVPAVDELTLKINVPVKYSNLTVTIYDNTGKKIIEKVMTDYYAMINLKNYSSGIYTCKVTETSTGRFENRKFIISK